MLNTNFKTKSRIREGRILIILTRQALTTANTNNKFSKKTKKSLNRTR